jgi:ABC-type nitrate/sulfonate/bicarbonate transport system substrate-binding protein
MRSLWYIGTAVLVAGLACLSAVPGAQAALAAGEQQVPFIFWGGDVATFVANGGLETTADSFYGKQGLKIKLVPGDDFDGQIKSYLEGRSPFLRGTLSMLGQASEQLTAKDETTPVVFLQLTWSEGDHLVGRAAFKNLNGLKGKKIALQKGGPHVGMLNDILNTARLTWKDITVVWTDDVNGDKGPAAAMRKDESIDGCFAISPEMFELTSAPATGGTESVGDGTKGSIKGAHVVVSSQHMSRSIADVYACRKDFYSSNKEWVDKFVAGYLKGSEDLMEAKDKADKKDAKAKETYDKYLKVAQGIWKKDKAFEKAVEKLEDVDGLVSDAVFVGLPGNKAFFQKKGNLVGLPFKQKQACVLPPDPSKEPLKTSPKQFEAAKLDYDAIAKVGGLRGKDFTGERFSREIKITAEGAPEAEIFRFTVPFEPDEDMFPPEKFKNDFQRGLELASLFANSVVAIQGHADPSLMVQRFIQAGKTAGILEESGGKYILVDGKKELGLGNTKAIIAIINADKDDKLKFTDPGGGSGTMRRAVEALQALSERRVKRVEKSLAEFAELNGLEIDKSQIRTLALGCSSPVVGNATTDEDRAKNRRVEFLVLKVPASLLPSRPKIWED